MPIRKIASWGVAGLLSLAALVLIVVALLPYPVFEALADGLMPDGNFKSLNGGNALIYRALLGAVGAGLLSLAYGVAMGKLGVWGSLAGRVWADGQNLGRSLRIEKDEWPFLAALGLILAVALIFRLERINDPMGHDESYTFVVFASSLWNAVTNYHLPNNHIFHTVLVFLSTRLFGIQPWAVRLPALLAGLLLIPVGYGLAKTIYDRYTALLAALLIAVLNGPIFYATNGRGYTLVALFTLLTLWLAQIVWREKNLAAWGLLALLASLGCYTVPVMVFPLGVVFGWLFLENLFASSEAYHSKLDFLRFWLMAGLATAGLTLLLYAPIFIYSGPQKVFANGWVLPATWEFFWAETPRRWLSTWQQWTLGAPAIVPVLLLIGLVLSLVLYPRLTRQRVPLQLVAILWIGAVLLGRRTVADAKVYVFLQAPFLIWAAAGLVGPFKEMRLKFARNVSLAGLIVALALGLVLIRGFQIIPTLPARWAETGAEERAIAYLKSQLTPQDLIIIASPFDAAAWYYAGRYGISENHFDNQQPFEHLFVIVSENDAQTLASVLQERGPDAALLNIDAAEWIQNMGYLDIYRVPHR
jgi:hypothetical protein